MSATAIRRPQLQFCPTHITMIKSQQFPIKIILCFLRFCPESCGQQAQAVRAACFRAAVHDGRHSQQGPVLLRHRAADAQRHRPGGRGGHQTAPPVCQAEAQISCEEEHHHHLWHRQSKDEPLSCALRNPSLVFLHCFSFMWWTGI